MIRKFLIIISIFLVPLTAQADNPPGLPGTYFGEVRIGGATPADGTKVIIMRSDGVTQCAETTTTSGGWYFVDCAADDGELLTFIISKDPFAINYPANAYDDDWGSQSATYAHIMGTNWVNTDVTCVPEVCDNFDNDCDGLIDNGIANIPADNVAGACSGNEKECSGGTFVDVATNYTPTTEVCDGIDNDCAGGVDDGIANIPADNVAGACSGNEKECSGGTFVDVATNYTPTTEVCDGIDNDCAGGIDDGIANIPADNVAGACSGNEKECSGGTFVDVATNYTPTTEVCDGIDNDCAGGVDDGIANIPADNVAGACSGNEKECSGGTFVDVATNYTPTTEVCDGIDNDCAGGVDDGIANIPADNVAGACSGNEKECSGGTFVDVATNYTPTTEVCDGIDNDCAGGVDDGIANIPADNVAGACSGNEKECSGGTFVDVATNYTPTTEVCDGIDNDCAGGVDDGIANIPADNVAGACSGNEKECSGGTFVDVATNYTPTTEVCDGIDNDCAGGIDDGIANIPADNVAGACSGNEKECSGGTFVDVATNYTPTAETCDGIDNNCDGSTDNNPTDIPTDGECFDWSCTAGALVQTNINEGNLCEDNNNGCDGVNRCSAGSCVVATPAHDVWDTDANACLADSCDGTIAGGTECHATVSLNLASGWNLISLPLEVANGSNAPDQILQPLTDAGVNVEVHYWDVFTDDSTNDNDDFIKYVSEVCSDARPPQFIKDEFCSLATMTMGRGYWLNNTSATNQTLAITGRSLAPTENTTSIENGWSMIGFGQFSGASTDVLTQIGTGTSILSWNPTKGESGDWDIYDPSVCETPDIPQNIRDEFCSLTTITPGQGYWIQTTQTDAVGSADKDWRQQ